MHKHLTFLLLSFGLLCLQNSNAQQFGDETDQFLLKVMYGDIKAADLDGDGDQDLVVSGKAGLDGNGRTQTYLNDGYGCFSLEQAFELPYIMFSSIATEDIDNDGDIDLFFSGTWSSGANYTEIYKNDGSGTFTEDNSYTLTRVTLGSSIFFDANGDGSPDLFYIGRGIGSGGVSKLYLNDGSGQLTDTPTSIGGFQSGSVAAADFDRDGDLDLLISGQTNSNGDGTKLFSNDGNGVFTEVQSEFAGVFDGSAVFSDIDNDDDLDIIVNGQRNGVGTLYSKFYVNDGTGSYTDVGNRGLDSLGSCSLVLADVDMDGDEDIFLTGKNSASADTCALYYNQDGFFTKDTVHYSQGLARGGALFLNMDKDCSPDLIYFGFGDLCLTQTYCFRNRQYNSCPQPENPGFPSQETTVQVYEVFSNPFRDQIRVEVSEKVFLASVWDMSGRLIYEYAPDSTTIDIPMAGMASGIYCLNFVTATEFMGTTVRLSKIN